GIVMATPVLARQAPAPKPDSTAKAGMGGMGGMDNMPGMGNAPKAGQPGEARLQMADGQMMMSMGNQVHATPPKFVTYNWRVIQLPGLINPLRTRGDFAANVAEGKRV